MNNLVTINPNNVKYISEYFTNLIFQLLYKDKTFSQILSLPEFSQPFGQAIDQFFQKAASQNIQLDINKMSDFSQNFDKLLPKSNEEDDYSNVDENAFDDIESENSFLEKNAKSLRNIKTAQWQARLVAFLIPLLKSKLGPLLSPLISMFPMIETIFNFLLKAIEEIIGVLDAAILEKLDPDFWKELVLSYNAYDAITESKRSEMYSIEAYNQMFENKAPRGYDGKLHSQGAYEVISDDMKNQFSQQVVNNPEIVQSRFQNDPNLAPRIKNKMNQYIASNNRRFVKVAQQEMSQMNQQALDTLKSVTPNWDISTVIKEVHAVYQSPDLAQEQKQQAIDATINKYVRAAQPLYKFLKENNFPTPDTAQ